MAQAKHPHEGHRERMYQRFLREGLDSFEEHQALELLLFFAKPRCDTNELAHALIQRFGSLHQVLDAPLEDLMQVKGVGRSCAVLCKLIPQMGRYYYTSRNRDFVQINSGADAVTYFLPRFYGMTAECFMVAFLDDKHKVLRCTTMAEGVINAVAVSSSKIAAEAISAGATNVILAHNHPGGIALPSAKDRWMTNQIAQALAVLNITVSDHVIICEDDGISFAESGFMLSPEDPIAFPSAASDINGKL